MVAWVKGLSHRYRRAALVTAFVLTGCTPEVGAPFMPIHDTGRLRIGTSFADGLCKGELDMWEAHIDEVEQTLGASREFAWLYLYRDDEQDKVAEDCGWDGALLGCWDDPVVRSLRLAAPHELVHAWLDTTQPRALPVLREGIAVRMSGLVMFIHAEPFAPEAVGPLTLEDLTRDIPGGKYDEAGLFVAWLMETYGAEKFMALYVRTWRGMSVDELSAAFVELLDQTPAELLAAHDATRRDYYPAMGGSACGRGPKVPWRDGAATWRTEGSCADGPLFGFAGADPWQRVTIEVPSDGWYQLDPGGRVASMTKCLTAPGDESEVWKQKEGRGVKEDWEHTVPMFDLYSEDWALRSDDWAERKLQLGAGTYEVWVQRRPEELPDETSEVGLFALDL